MEVLNLRFANVLRSRMSCAPAFQNGANLPLRDYAGSKQTFLLIREHYDFLDGGFAFAPATASAFPATTRPIFNSLWICATGARKKFRPLPIELGRSLPRRSTSVIALRKDVLSPFHIFGAANANFPEFLSESAGGKRSHENTIRLSIRKLAEIYINATK